MDDVTATVRRVLRWGWIAALAGVVVAVAVLGVLSVQRRGEATVEVALTPAAAWPHYDAIVLRQQGLVEDGELVRTAETTTGVTARSVRVETPDRLFTVLVRVVADDPSDAARLAAAVGDGLVAGNVEWLREQHAAAVSAAAATVVAQRDVVDGLRAQLQQATAALDAATAGGSPEGAVRSARAAVDVATQTLVDAERALGGYEQDLLEAERDRDVEAAQIEVVRVAEGRPDDSAGAAAAIAGLGAALVVGVLVLAVAARRERVGDAAGLAHLDVDGVDQHGDGLPARLVGALERRDGLVGVVGVGSADVATSTALRATRELARHGRVVALVTTDRGMARVEAVGPGAGRHRVRAWPPDPTRQGLDQLEASLRSHRTRPRALVDLGDVDGAVADWFAAACDLLLVVVPADTVALADLEARLARLRRACADLVVVVADPSAARPADVTGPWPSPGRAARRAGRDDTDVERGTDGAATDAVAPPRPARRRLVRQSPP